MCYCFCAQDDMKCHVQLSRVRSAIVCCCFILFLFLFLIVCRFKKLTCSYRSTCSEAIAGILGAHLCTWPTLDWTFSADAASFSSLLNSACVQCAPACHWLTLWLWENLVIILWGINSPHAHVCFLDGASVCCGAVRNYCRWYLDLAKGVKLFKFSQKIRLNWKIYSWSTRHARRSLSHIQSARKKSNNAFATLISYEYPM